MFVGRSDRGLCSPMSQRGNQGGECGRKGSEERMAKQRALDTVSTLSNERYEGAECVETDG